MKKFAIVVVLAIVTAGSIFAADVATTKVTASITQYLTVTTTGNKTIDELKPTTKYEVGTAGFTTNLKAWKITIASANNGVLQAMDGVNPVSGVAIPYKFDLDASANVLALVSTPLTTAGVVHSVTKRVNAGGESSKFYITTGDEDSNWLTNYTYTDTITLTVSVP